MGAFFFCRVAIFNALGIIEDSYLEVHIREHAIVGMTKSLAVGWAKDQIQVNCVIPSQL